MTDPMLSMLVVLIAIAGTVWMAQENWRPTPLFASGDWAARFGFGGKRRQESADGERRPDSDMLDEVAGGHYGGGRAVPTTHGGSADEPDPFDQIFGEHQTDSALSELTDSATPSIWSAPLDEATQSIPPPPPLPSAEVPADQSMNTAAADVILPPPPRPPSSPTMQSSTGMESSYRSDPSHEHAQSIYESSTSGDAAPWPSDMGLLEAIANMSTSDGGSRDSTHAGNSNMEHFDDWASSGYHGTPSVPELPLSAPPAIPFGDLAPLDQTITTDWATPAPVDSPTPAYWAGPATMHGAAAIPSVDADEVDAGEVDADSWHSWQWASPTTNATTDVPVESDADADEWDFESDMPTGTMELMSGVDDNALVNTATFDLPEVETAFADDLVRTEMPTHDEPPVRDAAALQSAATDFFEVLDASPPAISYVSEPTALATPAVHYPVTEMWLPDALLDQEAEIGSENWDEPLPVWNEDAWPESPAHEVTPDGETLADTAEAEAIDDVWAQSEIVAIWTESNSDNHSDDANVGTDSDSDDANVHNDTDTDTDTDTDGIWAADYGDVVELVDEIESVRLIESERVEIETAQTLVEAAIDRQPVVEEPILAEAHRSDPDETRVPADPVVAVGDKWASSLLDRLRSVVEAPAEAPDALAEFEERFERGLSFRLTDDQVFSYLGRGLDMIIPDAEAQILRADEFDELSEVERAGQHTRPGCAVSRGDLCPAVVQRRTLQFENSEHLDACPHMANRGAGPFSATCIPLRSSDETDSGVLHITTLVNGRLHDDTVAAIEKAAVQSADRLNQLGARQH